MSVHDVVAKHLSETPDAAELRRLSEACPMPDNDPDTLKDWYELEDLAERNYPIPPIDAAFIAAASPDVVLGMLDRLAHMAESRDNARAEVERLTGQIEAAKRIGLAHLGRPWANVLNDGLRPGETVCTGCWLVHPDGACDR